MVDTAQLRDWIRAGMHRHVDAWFDRQPPRRAAEHELFALNLIAAGRREQFELAHQHLLTAFELDPQLLSAGLNLMQLSLELGRSGEALALAERCVAAAPAAREPREKLFLALHAQRAWERCLSAAQSIPHPYGADAVNQSALCALLDETRSLWWRPRMLGSTQLRQPRSGDFPGLQNLLSDAAFRRRYHRDADPGVPALQRFIARAELPPLSSRRIDWVACRVTAGGEVFGLVSLVDIDWPNRRAELLVGCRPQANPMAAAQASVLAIQFAFESFGLEKLTSTVYGYNETALSNTLHLGFTQEGVLREHLRDGDRRVDVHSSGLLKAEMARLRQQRGPYSRWWKAVRVLGT